MQRTGARVHGNAEATVYELGELGLERTDLGALDKGAEREHASHGRLLLIADDDAHALDRAHGVVTSLRPAHSSWYTVLVAGQRYVMSPAPFTGRPASSAQPTSFACVPTTS